ALFPQPAARARLHNAAVAEHDAKVASDGANNNPFLHTTPPSPMLRRDGPSVGERLVHAHHAAHVHLQARVLAPPLHELPQNGAAGHHFAEHLAGAEIVDDQDDDFLAAAV